MQAAIQIGKYLVAHAEVAFQIMQEDRAKSDAEHVLGWIVRYRRKEFSKRELYQAAKNRFAQSEDLDDPLAELIKRFIVRPKSLAIQPKPRRPASPIFEVNPAVFQDSGNDGGNPENHPQYPQNSSQNTKSPPASGNCGDIGDAFEETNPRSIEDEINALLAQINEEEEVWAA